MRGADVSPGAAPRHLPLAAPFVPSLGDLIYRPSIDFSEGLPINGAPGQPPAILAAIGSAPPAARKLDAFLAFALDIVLRAVVNNVHHCPPSHGNRARVYSETNAPGSSVHRYAIVAIRLVATLATAPAALPTLSPCRYLHEPKARFPVGGSFPLPGRDFFVGH